MKNLKTLATVFLSGILLLTVACSTSDPAPAPPTNVAARLSSISPTGFVITFDVAVPGLVETDLALDKEAKITSLKADETNKTYTVVTSALTVGTTYTVAITKTGYTFTGTLTFVAAKSALADLASLKLGAEGYAIAIPAADGTTTLANAPRAIQAAAATLKIVAVISPGATMNPADLSSVDFSAGKTVAITITAEDGTTSKTYNFVITPYDATSNPYGVYTPQHLSNLRIGWKAENKYIFKNDIALPDTAGYNDATDPAGMGIANYSTAGWAPIGDVTNHFLAFVDGNNKVVSNLKINRSTTDYVGLFCVLGTGSVVKNLGVTTAAEGNVSGNFYVGVLAGYSNGTISYCYSKGAVSGAERRIGGLVGSNNGKINNSYSTASVSGDLYRIGGLVGWNDYGTIVNCYATGDVGGADNVAGLIGGSRWEGKIKNCYSTGRSLTSEDGGGLIAYINANPVNVLNCFWDTTSSQRTNSYGGTGKTTEEMKVATPYDETWTTENWTFTAGQYPKLVGVGGQ